MNNVDFGEALALLRAGKRVTRRGWNGRGMFLVLVEHWAVRWPLRADEALAQIGPNLPFIAMRTVHGELVPWLASQTDVLAIDWSEVS